MAITVPFATVGVRYWAHDGIQIFHISGEISIVVSKHGWTLESDKGETPLVPGKDEHFDSEVSFKIHSPTKATIEYAPSNSVEPLEQGEAAREAAMACIVKMADAGYGKGPRDKTRD